MQLAFKQEDETLEEAILSIQGIIWQMDMPPFAKERYASSYIQNAYANYASACEKPTLDFSNSPY
jgi:hypothetical protein